MTQQPPCPACGYIHRLSGSATRNPFASSDMECRISWPPSLAAGDAIGIFWRRDDLSLDDRLADAGRS